MFVCTMQIHKMMAEARRPHPFRVPGASPLASGGGVQGNFFCNWYMLTLVHHVKVCLASTSTSNVGHWLVQLVISISDLLMLNHRIYSIYLPKQIISVTVYNLWISFLSVITAHKFKNYENYINGTNKHKITTWKLAIYVIVLYENILSFFLYIIEIYIYNFGWK